MLFYSFFKTLIGKPVTIHLKNDVEISGTLQTVDQFLNLKITDLKVADEATHPHLLALKTAFVRGSVIRYVEVPKGAVDCELLEDASRREAVRAVELAKAGSKKREAKAEENGDGQEVDGDA